MAITKIPAAGFTGNNFRNIIINGDMSIAQRGTSSAASITSLVVITQLDRFNSTYSNYWWYLDYCHKIVMFRLVKDFAKFIKIGLHS
jgi:hypothetical protein